ncbi:BA75_01427T0 [Komagataella pastoris]|uniref:Calcium-transporting ATPase n=1 Tax=Komagataella pastoris TaxID=4922 RepID=A0A1B2J9B5_PICPA|nr:BA75_01427T0 [Komagataella pastoris]
MPSKFDIEPSTLSSLHDPKSLRVLQRECGGIDALIDSLASNESLGLDPLLPDEDERIERYGENILPLKKTASLLRLLFEAFKDKILILLSVAAVISLALGLYETFGQDPEHDAEGREIPKVEWVEGVAIIVAIAVVVVVSALNDWQKERQFSKLNAMKDEREVVVFRGGAKTVISIYDVLVGDVLAVETGDVVPVDCVLIHGSCETDESALTGETHTIRKVAADQALKWYNENIPKDSEIDIGDQKHIPDPFLLSGSKLLSGMGRALVTSVGPNSIHGKILASLQVDTEETPLQMRLSNLADGISKFGFLAALILFIILLIKFLANLAPGRRFHDITPALKGSHVVDILITAITVIVVAVPEGLPLAVTLALAFATTRMAKDFNLVRVLRSCETMGTATAICSDKTGTLTENRMRVVRGLMGNISFDSLEGCHNEVSQLSDKLSTHLTTNILINSTAFENVNEDGDTATLTSHSTLRHQSFWSKLPFFKKKPNFGMFGSSEHFIGSKTECALLLFAKDDLRALDGCSLEVIRQMQEPSIVQVIPFDSSRKWSGVVVKQKEGLFTFYIKGASEIVLSRCVSRCTVDGTVTRISTSIKSSLESLITDYASDALRTISLAHRDFEVANWPPQKYVTDDETVADPDLLFGDTVDDSSRNFASNGKTDTVPAIVIQNDESSSSDSGLTLDGIVGIQDPLRPGVPEAVLQCKKAGVTVRMVTGDNLITAKAISSNCNILPKNRLDDPTAVMEGPAFRKLSEAERHAIVPSLCVLARSSPDDKRLLVETLKDQREVVAVTGDGTNDAPALKLADVGFSMGRSGTEVAREASDIILMTDDFTAIVNAIKWGRTVSTSIRKFIQFQLTVNVTAVVLTFISAVVSEEGKSVLTAVQLLWVNLIMDTLAALALATDKPDDSFLDQKPAGRHAPLISVSMWKMIIGQSTLQLIITFIIYFAGEKIFFESEPTDHQVSQIHALTFNTFVWLQFFKLWVTRKLDEADDLTTVKSRITARNLNFFQHFFRNWYFLFIAAIIGGLQILIMFVGGAAFSVTRQTGAQWATALICGALALPWGILIRIIPDVWVVKLFPTRAFHFLVRIISLGMFNLGKNKRQEPLSFGGENTELQYLSPFERAKDGLSKLSLGSHESLPLNPFKWRSRSSSSANSTLINLSSRGSNASDIERTTATGLATMVPTVVGGAVAGWHPDVWKAGPKETFREDEINSSDSSR